MLWPGFGKLMSRWNVGHLCPLSSLLKFPVALGSCGIWDKVLGEGCLNEQDQDGVWGGPWLWAPQPEQRLPLSAACLPRQPGGENRAGNPTENPDV